MKKILIIILCLGVVFACDDRLADLNTPKKAPLEVPGEPLFTSGVKSMFDVMASTSVNENVFRLYSQYWAQTTYADESQYNMVSREIPDIFWRSSYRNALKDLEESRKAIERDWAKLGIVMGITEKQKDNQLAIINICKAYMFSVLIDVFGAAPYDEAFMSETKDGITANLAPKYESGAEVYNKVITMLNASVATLGTNATEDAFTPTQDPVYEGDVALWRKFANSLKLRLAMNLADVNPTKAATMVTEVLNPANGGIISSNAENTSITYYTQAPNTNPLWTDLVASHRLDFVPANTFVNKLNSLLDPRLTTYATPLKFNYKINPTTKKAQDSVITTNRIVYYAETEEVVYGVAPFTILASDSAKLPQIFKGGTYGSVNSGASNSHIGDAFHEPDLEGVIMDYAEVNFLLAEAKERGFAAPNTAATYYNQGITASMEYWGVDPADITAYLARPSVAYTGGPTWKQEIGTQAWIALYNRGFEGWTTWRRLDFTGLTPPAGLTMADIPRRLIFPLEEAQLNPTSYAAGVQLIGGTDNAKSKVFWDVN